MGESHELKCRVCGYSTTVSGGEDVGWNHETATIICHTCGTLQDAVTSKFDAKGIRKVRAIRCKRSKEHSVSPWRTGDPCPKCGGTLEDTGTCVLWD